MSDNIIGELIGVVEHTFSTKDNSGNSCQTTIKFDLSLCTDVEIKGWIVANRTIAMQRPLSKLTAKGILDTKGRVVNASDCGKALPDRDKMIDDTKAMFMKAGIDEEQALELATKAVDNPSTVAKAMSESNDNG